MADGNNAPVETGISNTVLKHAEDALHAVESAEALMSVAAMALRQQNTNNDGAVADVLEGPAWSELQEAREQLLELLGMSPASRLRMDAGVCHE